MALELRSRRQRQLWLNDVGQGALEEVDLVTRGGNYGWRCFEGTNSYQLRPAAPTARAPIAPVAQYGRTLGFSTTGGFVYRGSAIPALHGRYVFGDFGSGNLWNIARDTAPTLTLTCAGTARDRPCRSPRSARTPTARCTSFTSAARCIASCRARAAGRQIPAQLSATGCVNADDADAAGERAHSVRAQCAVLLRRRQ